MSPSVLEKTTLLALRMAVPGVRANGWKMEGTVLLLGPCVCYAPLQILVILVIFGHLLIIC